MEVPKLKKSPESVPRSVITRLPKESMLDPVPGKVGAAGNLAQVVDGCGLVEARPAKAAEIGVIWPFARAGREHSGY